jgi:hypothetical protein
MTTLQILAFGILGGTMVLLIWGRLRYDLVAIVALLALIVAGTATARWHGVGRRELNPQPDNDEYP